MKHINTHTHLNAHTESALYVRRVVDCQVGNISIISQLIVVGPFSLNAPKKKKQRMRCCYFAFNFKFY